MKPLFKLICVAIVGTICTLGSNLLAQNAPGADRYIVTLHPGNAPAQVAAAHAINPRHVFKHVLNGFAATMPPGRLMALANDPRVANIAVDHQVFAFAKPVKPTPDPEPATQTIPAGVTRIGAYNLAQTGAGVGVAILDTGLDFNHADLPISPYSFVSPGFAYYTTSAQDDAGHGTHVGGIVAAINNEKDVVGVAPGATLYAVKVLANTGSGYDSDIAAGLEWVVSANKGSEGSVGVPPVSPPIRVVNMSLGRLASADDSGMYAAVKAVVDSGVSVVVAAGNEPGYEVSQMVPAGFPEVIAVASTTAKAGTSNSRRVAPIQADTASFFTTDGTGVAISAPGEDQENIKFPNISSVGILSTALGGGTTRMSGTSMAAPHVAGVVALLWEKSASLDPALTPADIKAKIMFGDKELVAPYDSPTGSYSFDNVREGILNAPLVLQ